MSCALALLPSPVVDIRVLTSVSKLSVEIHREERETAEEAGLSPGDPSSSTVGLHSGSRYAS